MIKKHKECKEHKFQDKKYGYKMRVCNPSKNYVDTGIVICTVCGEKFSAKGPTTTKKAK